MPIGHLELDETLDAFRAACDELVASTWSGNAEARLALVAAPAMLALDAGGVPRPKLEIADVSPGLGAVFDPRKWIVSASGRLYAAAATTADQKRHRAVLLYHEARHSEQFFLALRMIAGKQERSVRDRNLVETLDARAWTAAQRSPLRPAAADARTIQAWIDEYPDARRIEDDLVRARDALKEVFTELRATVPDSFESEEDCRQGELLVKGIAQKVDALRDWFVPALAKYGKLAVEVDAYRVCSQVGGADPPKPVKFTEAEEELRTLRGKVRTRTADYRRRAAEQGAAPP